MYFIFSLKKKREDFRTDRLGEVVSVLNCLDRVNWAADQHLTVAEAVKLLTWGAETKLDAWNSVPEWWEFQTGRDSYGLHVPPARSRVMNSTCLQQGFDIRSGADSWLGELHVPRANTLLTVSLCPWEGDTSPCSESHSSLAQVPLRAFYVTALHSMCWWAAGGVGPFQGGCYRHQLRTSLTLVIFAGLLGTAKTCESKYIHVPWMAL